MTDKIFNPANKSPERRGQRVDPELRDPLLKRAEYINKSLPMIDLAVRGSDLGVFRAVQAEFTGGQVQMQPIGVSMQPTEVAPNAALPVEELAQSALSMSQVQTLEVSSAQAQVAEAYDPISISQFVIDHPRVEPLAAIGYEQIDYSLDDELAA